MKALSNNSAAPGPGSDATSPSHNATLTLRLAEPIRRSTSSPLAFRQTRLVCPAQGPSNSYQRLIPAIGRPDLKVESRPAGIHHALFYIEEDCRAPL